MYLLIINVVNSKKSVDELMKYSIFGGAILGFSGLYDLVQSDSLQRISGISQNSNIYFTMAIFMIPCIYWNLVINKQRFFKIFSFIIMLVLLFTSLYTQSRGGLISLGIFMTSYLLFTRKKFTWISIILIIGLFALIITPESFWNRFVDQGYYTTDRFTALWPAGVAAAKEKILTGYGIGVSEKIMPYFLFTIYPRLSVHNSLIALMIDLGLPGTFFYLLAIAFPTIQVFRLCCIPKKARQADLEKFGLVIFCALLAYLASWFKSGGFEYYKYLWFLVGLESSLVLLIKKERLNIKQSDSYI
jgi:hypothetical protein